MNKIEIIDYSEELKEYIKILNYEWLEKYFKLEAGDIISLSNPQNEIIDKGGYIFYAKLNNEIVGTASLLKKTDTVFELGKMAVTEKYQSLGIGVKLIVHCINKANALKIKSLVLYSNTQLNSAIHLYQKFGFNEIELEPGHYQRANIKMIKNL